MNNIFLSKYQFRKNKIYIYRASWWRVCHQRGYPVQFVCNYQILNIKRYIRYIPLPSFCYNCLPYYYYNSLRNNMNIPIGVIHIIFQRIQFTSPIPPPSNHFLLTFHCKLKNQYPLQRTHICAGFSAKMKHYMGTFNVLILVVQLYNTKTDF